MNASIATRPRLGWTACALGALALAAACGDTANTASDDGGNGDDGVDASSTDMADADPDVPDGSGGGTGPDGSPVINCSETTQCTDGDDNDGDGLVDGADPECVSCADDVEGSFATGIPGDNQGNRYQDCFFDGDSGSGNDGCRIETCCYDPECDDVSEAECEGMLSQQCIDTCGAAAPTGCDCFGCCTVCPPDGGECQDVYLAADPEQFPDCDENNLDACQTCTKLDSCGGGECDANPDDCILCPGETDEDLPMDCEDNECPGGNTSCDTDGDCSDGQYCNSGCCLTIIE